MFFIINRNHVRELFLRHGLKTQSAIARQFNVSKNTVTNWFKGGGVQWANAFQIAKFLDRDVDDLFYTKGGSK